VTQLTVRGFDPALERRLRELAEREGLSLSQAAVKLMRRGAGLEAAASDVVGDSLDWLFGSWSEEDASAFDEAVRVFEELDPELWR
jgi:hypothetical protein